MTLYTFNYPNLLSFEAETCSGREKGDKDREIRKRGRHRGRKIGKREIRLRGREGEREKKERQRKKERESNREKEIEKERDERERKREKERDGWRKRVRREKGRRKIERERRDRRERKKKNRERERERERVYRRQARNLSWHVMTPQYCIVVKERHKRFSCITLIFFLIKILPVHAFIMSTPNLHINCSKMKYKIYYFTSLNHKISTLKN